MYPNIQKAMTRNLKKSQKLMMILGPILFAYLFWWTWYSNGKVIDESNRFENGKEWLYTAITRARKKLVIVR